MKRCRCVQQRSAQHSWSSCGGYHHKYNLERAMRFDASRSRPRASAGTWLNAPDICSNDLMAHKSRRWVMNHDSVGYRTTSDDSKETSMRTRENTSRILFCPLLSIHKIYAKIRILIDNPLLKCPTQSQDDNMDIVV